MTQLNQIYKCNVCGNIVEVVHPAGGELVCCNQPMELLKEKAKAEEGHEKHVPVTEKTDKGIEIKIGSIPHPMEEKHYIEWVEIIADDRTIRKHLKPTDKPAIKFCGKHKIITIRAYCNVHGLWKS